MSYKITRDICFIPLYSVISYKITYFLRWLISLQKHLCLKMNSFETTSSIVCALKITHLSFFSQFQYVNSNNIFFPGSQVKYRAREASKVKKEW